MAKVVAYLRCKKSAPIASVRFRLTDGIRLDITHTSSITIIPNHFDSKAQMYKSRVDVPQQNKNEFNQQIFTRKALLLDIYANANPQQQLDSKWFNQAVEERLSKPTKPDNSHPIVQEIPTNIDTKPKELSVVEAFGEFILYHRISEVRKKNFRVIHRALKRYELYRCYNQTFKPLTFQMMTTDTLRKIEYFFQHEHELAHRYPKIYAQVPETRTPKPRSDNTISDMMTKIRTFIIDAIKSGLTDIKNPFQNYTIKGAVYGSPTYITLEELKQLYHTDLSHRQALAVQRDIFVFHSLCGARVSDLFRFTNGNIINDTIEYIPNKPKHIRATTVAVPLNDISREILARYQGGTKLLPFISEQKYNKAIKEMFKLAGITRKVSILNPLTRQEEQVPINTIASSHMCRRNMVANLYNLVQDTNLIGSLTGHSPNSKSFLRYRNIEKGLKQNLMNQLNFGTE